MTLLKFFRSSSSILLFITVFCGILTWLHVLVFPVDVALSTQYSMPAFQTLLEWLANYPTIMTWCGLILMLLEGFLLVSIGNKLNLNDKISYLPAFCYVMLIGGVPMIHHFSPVIIPAILLSISFLLLTNTFNSEKLSYSYFTVPILIVLATFFYRYAYIYMLTVWFSLLLRPKYWREWVFSILGFIFPLLVVSGIYFLVDDQTTYFLDFFKSIFAFDRIIPDLHISTIIFLVISALIGILAFIHLVQYLGSKKIIIRNSYYLLMCTIITMTITIIIIPDLLPYIWYLISFPVSYFLSNYLATTRSKFWGTFALLLLFAGIIATQTIYYLNTGLL